MAWRIAADNRLAVALIPKCGSRAISEWLLGFDTIDGDNSRLLDCAQRVVFIRNPLARLQSAFSWFNNRKGTGDKIADGIPRRWDLYVDLLLSTDNEHWLPQSDFIGEVSAVIHRLEDIEQIFYRYHAHPLQRTNISARLPASAYRLNEITDRYRKDFDYWLGADL